MALPDYTLWHDAQMKAKDEYLAELYEFRGCAVDPTPGQTANVGCIPPGKIMTVDDPPQTVYWSKPQNPDSWLDSMPYRTIPTQLIAPDEKWIAFDNKPRGRFEALLDKYDELLSRFGE